MKETTLVILLDSFRYDYLNQNETPYLHSLVKDSVYVKKLFNPGGYCERSVFMTGAGPKVTDNYFAMALMPIGYKRAEWEPQFSVPPHIRHRLALTEDERLDDAPYSFQNYTTGWAIPSIWDQLRASGKSWHIEACQALGVQSKAGRTTHGTRPVQLIDAIEKEHDLYYWQVSEIDQELHYKGTLPAEREPMMRWTDSVVEFVVGEFEGHFDKVNLVIFGDHGMDNVDKYVDITIDYHGLKEGWDYLYLKSSAAIQFWVFNPRVTKKIFEDPRLRAFGRFIDSPTKRQASIVWQANPGVLVSPCHFHGKGDQPRAMHGWDMDGEDNMDTMRGMAIVKDGEHSGKIEQAVLNDICPTICDLVGIDHPQYNEGKTLI